MELRLLDVRGDRIGDALMTVETHVAESGESAQEAFGDARAYARAIAPGSRPVRWPFAPALIVGILLGIIGLNLTTQAFGAWLDGERYALVLGDLLAAGLLLLLIGGHAHHVGAAPVRLTCTPAPSAC